MYKNAADYIRGKITLAPKIAIILGTGLGGVADLIENAIYIDYADVPNFPLSTVNGHEGKFKIGTISGVPVIAMCGRFHYYEGYTMQQLAMPIQVFYEIGIETIILTNASGAVNEDYSPADIIAIKDHIKFSADSPLRGKNNSDLGERFFDMTDAYNQSLRKKIVERYQLKEGVYAFMSGPQFETPAEIRMLKALGADLVGMSTVPEVITAAHCGIKVLGLSCVTNMAAGLENGGLNRDVIDKAEKTGLEKLKSIIKEAVTFI